MSDAKSQPGSHTDQGGSFGDQSSSSGERNPWLILIVLCGAIFMLLLDTTIVNVAQQKIKEGLNADLSQIQWILDSYILAFAVLMLSFGRLGDIYGRKKMFVTGMVVFTAASGLCGVSDWIANLVGISGATALIVARVLQGIGGALMMPQTLSLITIAFPPQKRGAAMGVWGSVVALGAVLGPLLGGYIVTDYPWEWVFLINIPVGIIAVLATLAIVPESRDPLASGKLDWGGLVFSALAIFALVYALIEGPRFGWMSPQTIGLLLVSAAVFTLFVWWERRVADPMVKLELFGIRNFWVANVIGLAVPFGLFGIFFPMTLFLQGALGMSPLEAGLTMMPMSLMLMFVAPLSGRLSDRVGARWILTTGLTLVSVGIVLITSNVSTTTNWRALLPALLITGTGMGMTFAPMTAAAMSRVPPRISGSASGILNTSRNVGQLLGIAVLGSILQSRLGLHAGAEFRSLPIGDAAARDQIVELVRTGRVEAIPSAISPGMRDQLPVIFDSMRQVYVLSMHETFYVGAVICFVALGFSFLMQNPGRRPAQAAGPVRETSPRPVAAD
ncbi:MAG TPA: DHA2 family efflux MFS transporter permease subunit [Thermomicrobiales bacterium]|jgi:EmrB/QacA subfamily drug resistance transporter|nr:DHA2 family efflux MFS transporter permease subunit [Thermomicrobiales bacterium]